MRAPLLCHLALALVSVGHGAKILAVFPFAQTSHQILFKPLVLELTRRGHQVTYMSPFKYKETHENLKELIIPNFWAERETQIISAGRNANKQHGMSHVAMYNGMLGLAKDVLQCKEMIELLSSDQTFDAIITEAFFSQEWTAVLAHRFKSLRIVITTVGGKTWVNELSGLSDNPSYLRDNSLFEPGPPKNLYERLISTAQYLRLTALGYYFVNGPMQNLIDELVQYPGWETRPRLSIMAADNALILVNSHVSIGEAVPTAPHVKFIGGININFDLEQKPKQLDQPGFGEIKRFLDDSKDGFLLFNLGSVVKPDKMLPSRTFETLYNAFSKLKINVIMRWVGSDIPKKVSPNIKLCKDFLPQIEVLAHKNIKAFLTHGGLLSLTESIYFGVPIIGFPVFAEQPLNIRRAEYRGFGIYLDIRGNLTETSISWAVDQILNNPTYKKETLRRSALLRDRIITPVEEATYWTEYVIKHGNVLQPASVHMPFYQLLLLDVIGVVVCTIGFVIYVLQRIVRAVRQHLIRKRSTADKKTD